MSFGGDTKSRRSLISGAYARGNKISHQSAMEIHMCNLSWTPPLLEKDNTKNNPVCKLILKFECFTVSEGKERNVLFVVVGMYFFGCRNVLYVGVGMYFL